MLREKFRENRLLTALVVLAASVGLALSTASPTTAAPSAAAPPSEPTAAVVDAEVEVLPDASCRARFKQGVKHRARATTNSTALGIIPKGRWVPATCSRVSGGKYSACGGSSSYWLKVKWNGRWGYSAWYCMKDWEYK
ncbi:hypothetical protein [Salininema proteolyticum]|uniref:SH3 domain-containing protein n=1 Tax=Salininema proteolyticum TaxID=1607685 RepID=A0ABV8TWW9_9ACTN